MYNVKRSTHLAFHQKYCVIEIDIQFSHKTANGTRSRPFTRSLNILSRVLTNILIACTLTDSESN